MLKDLSNVPLDSIANRLQCLKTFLNTQDIPSADSSSKDWQKYLTAIKSIEGNLDNSVSFVACLLAKEYLLTKFSFTSLDVAEKHQNASGLDISTTTVDGRRIIAEIKTTTPAGNHGDLGANQKATFRKDFAKLNKSIADHKFFFVTDSLTFQVMKSKYAREIPGVTVVLLPDGQSI